MGYKKPTRVVNLSYEDHPGLTIRARSVTMGRMFSMSDLASTDTKELSIDALRDLFRPFADAIIEWNLEESDDDPNPGEPIPASLDGILTLDLDFALDLMMGWMDSIASIPLPLDRLSNGGKQPPAPPLPMEALSQSQAS